MFAARTSYKDLCVYVRRTTSIKSCAHPLLYTGEFESALNPRAMEPTNLYQNPCCATVITIIIYRPRRTTTAFARKFFAVDSVFRVLLVCWCSPTHGDWSLFIEQLYRSRQHESTLLGIEEGGGRMIAGVGSRAKRARARILKQCVYEQWTRAALWCGFAASEPPTRAVTNVASGGNWCIFGQSCVKRFVFWLLLCTRIDWVARVRFVCVCARGDDKG